MPTAALVVALSCGACAGSGEGLDAGGRPIDENPPPDGSLFLQIQTEIFTPICTQCHEGANAPQGLRLDAANSYAMLVNVASAEVPSLLRVNPGNPDATKLKVKSDPQTDPRAKDEGEHTFSSDDEDVFNYGQRAGRKVIRTGELDLPPEDPQLKMDLLGPDDL